MTAATGVRPGHHLHVPRAAHAALATDALRWRLRRPGASRTPVWTIAADAVWPHTVTLLGHRGHGLGARNQTLVARRSVRRRHALGPAARCGHRGRRRRAAGLAAHEPVGSPWSSASVSATFLALLCLWTTWCTARGARSAPTTTTSSTSRRRALETLTNQLGMWVSPRPRHLRLDADPAAADACPRPRLERPPRLGPGPAGRRPGLHRGAGRAHHLQRWRQLLRLPARDRVRRVRDAGLRDEPRTTSARPRAASSRRC